MKRLSILVLSSMLLAACGGEFAYKRGAGADELQADQAQCRAAGGDYDACMSAHGWSVVRPGSMIATVDPGPAPAATTTNPGTPAPATAVTTPNTSAPTAATWTPPLLAASSHADNRDPSPPPQVKPPPRPYNPLEIFAVSSWWKRGGTRDDLNAAAGSCSGKLGDPHKLQPRAGGGDQVTAALLLCLRDQGWYGLAIPRQSVKQD